MYNQPHKSIELQLLEMAARRTELSKADQTNLFHLQRGHEGERRFAALARTILPPEHILKHSTTLKRNNRVHQIDSMIILQGYIYLLEIKYYYGDYYYFQDDFYLNTANKRIANPFHQLQRSEDLLREHLKEHNFRHQIHPLVIFANPEFTLYRAPRNLPVIMPTQINRFLEKLRRQNRQPSEQDFRLVSTLMQASLHNYRHESLPVFDYQQLKKGIICLTCGGDMCSKGRRKLICQSCKGAETMISAILRSTVEFNLAFPNEIITTNQIHEWCGNAVSIRTIRRILDTYMKSIGKTKSTHYQFY